MLKTLRTLKIVA